MKKNNIKKTTKEINYICCIFVVLIVLIMYCRTLQIKHKLRDSEIVIANVLKIYRSNHGLGLWGHEMKYKFYYKGKEYEHHLPVQENELEMIEEGNCIEIYLSRDDMNVQKWNKSKGSFKCN
jgi:hypothetical protein